MTDSEHTEHTDSSDRNDRNDNEPESGTEPRNGGAPQNATRPENATEPAPAADLPSWLPKRRQPWWHWRRLTRGRWRPALAAAVAGALLGATGVAWQTGTGPFTDESRACWSALGTDDVAELFDGHTDIDASDTPITTDGIGEGGPSGTCVLKSPRGARVTIQAHRLDLRFGGAADQWADEFLSARLTPMGGGLLGMASDTRAWLAVPDGCIGRPGDDDGPTVFDIDTGWTVYRDQVRAGERDRLTRTAVKLVNHYMAGEGCEGTLGDPVDRMPDPPRFQDEKPGAICGIKGLSLPKGRHEAYEHERPLVTRGDGPVRTCDRDVLFDHPSLRLMTVQDPRLSVLYRQLSYDGGKPIKTPGDRDGYGFVRDDFGLFQAACQTGEVTFLVRADDSRHPGDIRRLLPRYAAAEADRVGCGPLRIELPA
ncbi:hypothetical protein HUT19_29435 [Streptomyces sp. NA02950]|uniref:hypothetical protein n=1 Tax=Streptomyces sp. NA02950 TaxID=2742137 RepID=UPI001591ABA4|nr:hypothetical protein [Streptomyces sp. NA02950]QKV95342.1 hypothetical protein HUT19_29435 [Streptomyces sp. NA02950]